MVINTIKITCRLSLNISYCPIILGRFCVQIVPSLRYHPVAGTVNHRPPRCYWLPAELPSANQRTSLAPHYAQLEYSLRPAY